MSTILIVEDEMKIATMIANYLHKNDFQTFIAEDGVKALEMIKSHKIDLMLLDWMLPVLDGVGVLDCLRENRVFVGETVLAWMPIIMLTAKDSEDNKIEALLGGVDDYINKPFSLKELVARINAHLRRIEGIKNIESEHNILQVGAWEIDLERREIFHNKQIIELTRMHFDMLYLFLKNSGKVLPREKIMEFISPDGFYDGFHRTIDAHIKNMRKRIEPDPKQPVHILTVRGVGYRFES